MPSAIGLIVPSSSRFIACCSTVKSQNWVHVLRKIGLLEGGNAYAQNWFELFVKLFMLIQWITMAFCTINSMQHEAAGNMDNA